MPASDVVVIGGGVIGAAIAWRCAQGGRSVTVLDPDARRGAWNTAAGMLAPTTELHTTETPLAHLGLASLALWPEFAAELQAETGQDLGYRETGTLLVAWDGADMAALRLLHELADSIGVPTTMLAGRETRELEPALAAGVPGALHAPNDHQVDPRLLHAALVRACQLRGVRFVDSTGALLIDRDQVRGVRVEGGQVITTPRAVIAAGAWSAKVEGVPPTAQVAVRPVKGQTLRLRLAGRSRLSRVVRGSIHGSSVYVVPRADGRYVVGASTEEAGFSVEPRAGAVYELLRDAQTLIPELGEAILEEVSTGLRPGSPDNAPLIGPADIEGLVYATGHHRNGILLTPVTAAAVARLLLDLDFDPALHYFLPQRVVTA